MCLLSELIGQVNYYLVCFMELIIRMSQVFFLEINNFVFQESAMYFFLARASPLCLGSAGPFQCVISPLCRASLLSRIDSDVMLL